MFPSHSIRRALRSSPTLAGFLSFLLPGLGQLLAGAVRRGLLLALPIVAIAILAAAAFLLDRPLILRALLNPAFLLGAVALSMALLVYRSWAIIDAYRLSRRRHPEARLRAGSLLVLVGLLAITVYSHGWVAYLGWSAHQTLAAVFDPAGPPVAPSPSLGPMPSGIPAPSPSASPSPSAVETPTPSPTPAWAADGRLNVLLIGSDAGPGRWSMRADAIILVSIDVASGRVAAFSLPRYTLGVPLPEPAASAFSCGCAAHEYANALYVYANQHPELFPGGDERGLKALSGMAERLFGVQLDGMVVADLNGFVKLVDAIGGITLTIPQPVYDAKYRPPDGGHLVELYFPAGKQHLDGWHALAYARTRHQDGDFNRMKRQQQVVQALGRELRCDPLGDLPAVLDVARESLWTNLPLASVPDMLEIDAGPVESHLLFDVYNPVLTPADWDRVASAVAHAFDGPPPTMKPGSRC
ncbi:MAG TPA: LCP family protein [Candidatus Limnocylindria bacterium]|nr:LCP family protein [Candidatus Limnocylindria bacterium]